jgi:hypothetical protein
MGDELPRGWLSPALVEQFCVRLDPATGAEVLTAGAIDEAHLYLWFKQHYYPQLTSRKYRQGMRVLCAEKKTTSYSLREDLRVILSKRIAQLGRKGWACTKVAAAAKAGNVVADNNAVDTAVDDSFLELLDVDDGSPSGVLGLAAEGGLATADTAGLPGGTGVEFGVEYSFEHAHPGRSEAFQGDAFLHMQQHHEQPQHTHPHNPDYSYASAASMGGPMAQQQQQQQQQHQQQQPSPTGGRAKRQRQVTTRVDGFDGFTATGQTPSSLEHSYPETSLVTPIQTANSPAYNWMLTSRQDDLSDAASVDHRILQDLLDEPNSPASRTKALTTTHSPTTHSGSANMGGHGVVAETAAGAAVPGTSTVRRYDRVMESLTESLRRFKLTKGTRTAKADVKSHALHVPQDVCVEPADQQLHSAPLASGPASSASSLASASPPPTAQAPTQTPSAPSAPSAAASPGRKLELTDYEAIEEFYLSCFSDASNVGFGMDFPDQNIAKRPSVYSNEAACRLAGVDLRNQYHELLDTPALMKLGATVEATPLEVRLVHVEKVCMQESSADTSCQVYVGVV